MPEGEEEVGSIVVSMDVVVGPEWRMRRMVTMGSLALLGRRGDHHDACSNIVEKETLNSHKVVTQTMRKRERERETFIQKSLHKRKDLSLSNPDDLKQEIHPN